MPSKSITVWSCVRAPGCSRVETAPSLAPNKKTDHFYFEARVHAHTCACISNRMRVQMCVRMHALPALVSIRIVGRVWYGQVVVMIVMMTLTRGYAKTC